MRLPPRLDGGRDRGRRRRARRRGRGARCRSRGRRREIGRRAAEARRPRRDVAAVVLEVDRDVAGGADGRRLPVEVERRVAARREIDLERQRLRRVAGDAHVAGDVRALLPEVAQHDRELVARTLIDAMHVGDRDLGGRCSRHRDRDGERIGRAPATGVPSAAITALSTVAVTCASAEPGCVSCGTAIVIGTVVATCGSSWIASSPNAIHEAAAVPRLPVASVAVKCTVRRRFAVWFDTTRSCSSDAPASSVTASPEPATCEGERPTASFGIAFAGVAFAGAAGSAATGPAATANATVTPARSAINRLMSDVPDDGARGADGRALIGQMAW